MIRTPLILTSAAAVALAVSACGFHIESDGPHTVQTRTVGAFDHIDLRGSTDVVVTHGRSPTLTVSGGRNRVRDVITRVQSGTLIVEERDSDPTLHLGDDGPTVTVTTPSLVGARLDGSGDVDANGHLDALDAAVDGSGDLDLSDVVAQSARVNLSGSGDADVHAVRTLAVVVSCSGDVSYAGEPQLTRDVSGSGDVSHR